METIMTKAMAQEKAVEDFLKQFPDRSKIVLKNIPGVVLQLTNAYFDVHNAAVPKDERWRKLSDMTPYQYALLFTSLYHMVRIDLCATEEYFAETGCALKNTGSLILSYYHAEEGIYYDATEFIHTMTRRICGDVSDKSLAEITSMIRSMTPIASCTMDPDLIPVHNGIFDYKTKVLRSFDPKYVYMTKCPVDYIPGALNPVIHNDEDGTDWDIESWMKSLTDDDSVAELLWQVTGACIRPGVRWDKSAWLYSTSGNSGKGTLCELMRSLCGNGNHVSLSVSQFDDNPFRLEGLIGVSAVITDENDVGVYIDKSKNMKAAITGDVIQIDRKYKTPINYRFRGFIVQCLNELPKIRDRSESYARRQLIIPMEKCFTGAERKYIKNDYLKRKEVLEYALCKILNTNYYELEAPASCNDMLKEYKTLNNPVRDFAEQILPQTKWDLLPFTFLYDLYKAWFKENNPSGTVQGSRTFQTELADVLKSGGFDYNCLDRTKLIRTGNQMDVPEPLILRYNLTNWMNKHCKSNDVDKLCIPGELAQGYRGIRRIIRTGTP